MKFSFIDATSVAFPVVTMCRVLGVSPSGYYAWKKCPISKRAESDAKLATQVAKVYAKSRGIYGSPRVHHELRANGVRVARKRVASVMRKNGLRGRCKQKYVRTTDSRHEHPVAPNLLERRFETSEPNQAWVGDVTCVATHEGWLYLAVLLDLFSRRVVGWATSDTNDRALALAALDDALRTRRPRAGALHHTDRGSPYASGDYRAALEAHGLVASMSRTGDCWDNAVAEGPVRKTVFLDEVG